MVSTSPRQDAWRRLKKNKAAMFGLVVLGVLIVLSILGPWITPYSYSEQNLELGPSSPSPAHWLGSDLFGRDLLTRILYGSRILARGGFYRLFRRVDHRRVLGRCGRLPGRAPSMS